MEIEITSSYRGFEQEDQKRLIKVVLCLYMFYCKISSSVRALKQENKTKSMKTTSTIKYLLIRIISAKFHNLTLLKNLGNLTIQIVMAHKSSKVKIDFELPRVKLQSKVSEGK